MSICVIKFSIKAYLLGIKPKNISFVFFFLLSCVHSTVPQDRKKLLKKILKCLCGMPYSDRILILA